MATEEIVESRPKSSRHYSSGAPWLFRGSALYQLHLVKSEIARAFIPKELRLVEAFGYTLGGLFLACYEDSPAGAFDELVVISGIVWNPPTSCAWAARVLVNSEEACRHGRKVCCGDAHPLSIYVPARNCCWRVLSRSFIDCYLWRCPLYLCMANEIYVEILCLLEYWVHQFVTIMDGQLHKQALWETICKSIRILHGLTTAIRQENL